MKLTNFNALLTREVTRGEKSCFELNTFFLKKSLKDFLNDINLEKKKKKEAAIKLAKQVLKNLLPYALLGISLSFWMTNSIHQ